jgi:hypothetical protein
MMQDITTGFEPIRETAARHGRTTRAMKRQLLKLRKQLLEKHPDEPPIIQQFGGPHSEWRLDRSVAWRRARGLVVAQARSPLEAVLEALIELRDQAAENRVETLEAIARIEASTDTMRDILAGR